MRALTASSKFSGWSAPPVARELSRPFLSSPHHNLRSEAFNARGSFRIPLTVRGFIPPVRFQLAFSNGLFPYPTRLRVKVWEDKLAAMLEQMTQKPVISRSCARLFLGQNGNIGPFIECFRQVFQHQAKRRFSKIF
jgi:hypothetical protein